MGDEAAINLLAVIANFIQPMQTIGNVQNLGLGYLFSKWLNNV
jgi:hypothetical protein